MNSWMIAGLEHWMDSAYRWPMQRIQQTMHDLSKMKFSGYAKKYSLFHLNADGTVKLNNDGFPIVDPNFIEFVNHQIDIGNLPHFKQEFITIMKNADKSLWARTGTFTTSELDDYQDHQYYFLSEAIIDGIIHNDYNWLYFYFHLLNTRINPNYSDIFTRDSRWTPSKHARSTIVDPDEYEPVTIGSALDPRNDDIWPRILSPLEYQLLDGLQGVISIFGPYSTLLSNVYQLWVDEFKNTAVIIKWLYENFFKLT